MTKTKSMRDASLVLRAETAGDIMMPNPVSIRADAVLKEAIAFLTDKGFSAAPVIDRAGRPIGVLSRADIVVHDREKIEYAPALTEAYERSSLAPDNQAEIKEGFQVENVDRTPVRDIMTPVVFSVTPKTPVAKVVEDMTGLRVHRLFVVDDDGVLVGVISTLDVLRHLRPMADFAAN